MSQPTFNAATETRLVITNLESCKRRNGLAYSCDVYFDGQHLGTANNAGDGCGTVYIDCRSHDTWIASREYASSFAPIEVDGYSVDMDLDMAIAMLCDHAEETGRTATN